VEQPLVDDAGTEQDRIHRARVRLDLVAQVLVRLRADGEHLAVAESLTGGLVASSLVSVPGASAVLRGGVVAYATELKAQILGVDAGLLVAHGAVHPDVARQMAVGVARLCGTEWGVSTTGVAGPEAQDGHPPGLVYVAVAGLGRGGFDVQVRGLRLYGDRTSIREAACDEALAFLAERIGCVEDPVGQ
jgi:nicotinamide-nucleotide amidase